jgi:hypothetical protein
MYIFKATRPSIDAVCKLEVNTLCGGESFLRPPMLGIGLHASSQSRIGIASDGFQRVNTDAASARDRNASSTSAAARRRNRLAGVDSVAAELF